MSYFLLSHARVRRVPNPTHRLLRLHSCDGPCTLPHSIPHPVIEVWFVKHGSIWHDWTWRVPIAFIASPGASHDEWSTDVLNHFPRSLKLSRRLDDNLFINGELSVVRTGRRESGHYLKVWTLRCLLPWTFYHVVANDVARSLLHFFVTLQIEVVSGHLVEGNQVFDWFQVNFAWFVHRLPQYFCFIIEAYLCVLLLKRLG